jgi:hypothetical protein
MLWKNNLILWFVFGIFALKPSGNFTYDQV